MQVDAPFPVSRLTLLVLFCLYAAAALTLVKPVLEPDIWWHLATGRWIATHGTVPATDPFSRLGEPWHAYSWLLDIAAYGLHEHLGLLGLVLGRAALAIAIMVTLDRWLLRRSLLPLLTVTLMALVLLVLVPLFNERPWLVTILFTSWTLAAVLALRRGDAGRSVWLLPLLFILWANLHIQFVYGLGILGLACVAPLIDRWLGTGDRANPQAWRRVGLLTGLCVLATLANPYHVRLYEVVLEYAGHDAVYRLVRELMAPDFRQPASWAGLTLALGAAFALGKRQHLSSFDVLLLVAAAALAFRSRRDLWFVALVALMQIAETWSRHATGERSPLGSADPSAADAARTSRVSWLRAGILAVLLAAVVAAFAWLADLTPQRLQEAVAARYPVEAVRHVRQRGDAGPLFNHFDWGGYLIWELPDLPVSIDGRTSLHGDARIARYSRTWGGLPDWDQDPELRTAGIVIAQADQPLVSLLRRDPRFRLVHEDRVAVIFVRTGSR